MLDWEKENFKNLNQVMTFQTRKLDNFISLPAENEERQVENNDTTEEKNLLADDSAEKNKIQVLKATPEEIKQWHENLKTDKRLGLLRYYIRRNWGELADEFLKIVEDSALFEKYKIGFNGYGSIYIFALDDTHYIKAQTYCYRINDDFFYYIKNGEEFLEKIKELLNQENGKK